MIVAGTVPAGAQEFTAANVEPVELAYAEAQNTPQSVSPIGAPGTAARDLFVRIGKSLVLDSPIAIERVSVANGEIAEAIAVSPNEIVINGRGVGETSLIVWQRSGQRMLFDLKVNRDLAHEEAVRRTLQDELSGDEVDFELESGTVFLRGRVSNLTAAGRAEAIVGTLAENVVNLLQVDIPDVETQILLKVKFANVDRSVLSELGVNLFSTGALNTQGSVTTQQFGPPQVNSSGGSGVRFTFQDALNIFMFRPDLDFGLVIKALTANSLLEILAEPNVLAINGKPASFLAGGEFPFPTVQGGGLGGAITIQFREFGVRLNFVPRVTPRGTIRLEVEPEVSTLDFANGLVFQGFTIPAISTRRVRTEIELESGQSFAIGGLLDDRVTENLSKIPGLGDIPYLGKLFQSRSLSKSHTELFILVTPEIVRPMTDPSQMTEIEYPKEFMKGMSRVIPRTAGLDVTGPVPIEPPSDVIPIEELRPVSDRQGDDGVTAAPTIPPMILAPTLAPTDAAGARPAPTTNE